MILKFLRKKKSIEQKQKKARQDKKQERHIALIRENKTLINEINIRLRQVAR